MQFEQYVEALAKKFSSLKNDEQRESFINHLESLCRWNDEPMDYPEPTLEFPDTIPIAQATCHPECRTEEFIVDGSTQECQRCGGHLFRHDVKLYRLVKEVE